MPGQNTRGTGRTSGEPQLLEADVRVLGRHDLDHLRQAQEVVVDVQVVVLALAAEHELLIADGADVQHELHRRQQADRRRGRRSTSRRTLSSRCAWIQTMIAAPTVTPMMRRPPPCDRNASMMPDSTIESHACER